MKRSVVAVAMVLGLAGCSGGQSSTSAPGEGTAAGSAETPLGARLYEANCIACHQPDGRGIPGVYPSLAGSPVVQGDAPALAAWIIQGRRPAALPAGRYSTLMPQFGWLKPAPAAALLTYLRANFGNAAAPVDPATVARAVGGG